MNKNNLVILREIKMIDANVLMELNNNDEIVKYVKENCKPSDIVLTLGAGTVTNIGPMLVDEN